MTNEGHVLVGPMYERITDHGPGKHVVQLMDCNFRILHNV